MPTITRRPSLGPNAPATTTRAREANAPAGAVEARAGSSTAPNDAVVANTPALLGGPARTTPATRVSGTRLADGVSLEGGKLVVDGFKVAARASLQRSGGAVLLSAAARVCEAGTVGKLSAAARASVVDELLPLLRMPGRGRPSIHEVRARSGAFTLVEECLLHMKGKGEQRAAASLAQVLVQAALDERHPGLRTHMERRLAMLPARCVPKALAPAVEEMRVRHAHEKPDESWLKGNPPTLKVLESVQDEFWKEELAEYKAQGFEVSSTKAGRATARKTITDVEPPAVIEVDLRLRDTEVFDGLDERDVDVVIYTGHANLGGIAKASLENGPAKAHGTKLVAMLACRSKQNLEAIERRYPGQHLLVSDDGTYGHDDRIVLHKLLDGIVRKKTYAQIEMSAKRAGLWESKNYWLPNETSSLLLPLDKSQRVFAPESHLAAGRSISMRPARDIPPASTTAPGPVDDAVAWLNTIHAYWAEQQGTRADKGMADRIVSRGFFDPKPGDPPVKVRFVGESNVEVSVSSAYAKQDKDALGMMVSFLAGQELAKRGDPSRSDHDRRMLGLAMVASYTYFLVEYSDSADLLLRQFAKTFGFPPGLSWPAVEKSIQADPENDCSPKSIQALERAMEHVFLEVNPARTTSQFRRYVGAALEELQKSESKIGRLTLDMIASGQVRIDELSDLTRADYLRVRRDLMKAGTDIPADHAKLDDKRGRAWRAITSDMNGYMWDDRIYVAPGLSPKDLAAVLVHEVNHVRNKSEEHYRGDQAIFVEEYRAFYAEALFHGEPLNAETCRRIKLGVIRDYGLKDVSPDDIPDVPPGLLDA